MKKGLWAIAIVVMLGLIAMGASTVTTAKPAVQKTVKSSSDCCIGQAGTGSATLQKDAGSACPSQTAANCPANKNQSASNKSSSCTRSSTSI